MLSKLRTAAMCSSNPEIKPGPEVILVTSARDVQSRLDVHLSAAGFWYGLPLGLGYIQAKGHRFTWAVALFYWQECDPVVTDETPIVGIAR